MQVEPPKFLCSFEQTVMEIYTFRVGGFPVRITLLWTGSSLKVAYKINKSSSLCPSQIVYKNNSILQRFCNTRENFGGNNLKRRQCDLPVTESGVLYKLKEISSLPNTENRILGDDNRLGGVSASVEGRVNFQKVSGYIANAGGINKRPSKNFCEHYHQQH